MKSDNKHNTNEERRKFLGVSMVLASGIVITPLALTGCGGDSAGNGRTAPKGGKSSGKRPPAGSGDGGSSDGGSSDPGVYEVVNASDIGSKQAVKVTVNYKGPHVEWTDPSLKATGLSGDDGARAMGDVDVDKYYPQPSPLGTRYVVNEKVLTLKDGDAVRLANCIVVLEPRGVAKVAKNTHAAVEVQNHYFRFEPRVHDVAARGHVTWVNGDPVNHAIATSGVAPTGNGPNISNGGTMAANGKLNTEGLGFIRKGYYSVSCSLHSWELGRIMVTDHAYVGWTNKDNKGVVAIDNVADGKYELQIWHETSNSAIVKKEIEVKAGQVEFSVDLDKMA